MVFLETKLYLRYLAKSNKIQFNHSSLDVLYRYIDVVQKYGYRLDFHWWRHATLRSMCCNAGYGKSSSIVATPGWAAKLVFDDSDDIHNAFLMSLGHEMTHKDNDIKVIKGMFIKNGIKFLAHMNEVHADFGAVQKLANSNREKQLKAMNYKQSYKKNVDVSDFCHPSWNQRYDYIEKYNFDESLIRKIAADVGCANEKLIEKAIRHFNIIQLN